MAAIQRERPCLTYSMLHLSMVASLDPQSPHHLPSGSGQTQGRAALADCPESAALISELQQGVITVQARAVLWQLTAWPPAQTLNMRGNARRMACKPWQGRAIPRGRHPLQCHFLPSCRLKPVPTHSSKISCSSTHPKVQPCL